MRRQSSLVSLSSIEGAVPVVVSVPGSSQRLVVDLGGPRSGENRSWGRERWTVDADDGPPVGVLDKPLGLGPHQPVARWMPWRSGVVRGIG